MTGKIIVKQTSNQIRYMKSSLRSPHLSCLKAALLIIQLALCFRGSAVAQPEEIDSSPGLARPIRLGNAGA
jgi:hypothetical protein